MRKWQKESEKFSIVLKGKWFPLLSSIPEEMHLGQLCPDGPALSLECLGRQSRLMLWDKQYKCKWLWSGRFQLSPRVDAVASLRVDAVASLRVQ